MRDPFSKHETLRLKPLQVPGFPGPIELVDDHLTIGRSENNDLHLPGDVFPSVSTHHARLDQVDDVLKLEDLGSKNGTLVNGERIENTELKRGDVIQLGSIGPRFVVVSSAPLSETMFVDPQSVREKGDISETVVTEIVKRRTRRTHLGVAVAIVVVTVSLVVWATDLADRGRDEIEESYQQQLNETYEAIAEFQERERQREATFARAETDRQAKIVELGQVLETLRESSSSLQRRLASLEQDDAASTEIASLRENLTETRFQLQQAQERFELLDPVNLEQTRLSEVGRVREAIVLIEARMTLKNTETGKYLFESYPGYNPNFDEVGSLWELETTGSGFTISAEGWILTNGHVVSPPYDHPILLAVRNLPNELRIEPELEIAAVFSGTSVRHNVTVVKKSSDADLALVKIEPFDSMPYLEDFRLDAPTPEPGSALYLFGFPLGNFALQEGETVIASTFRGILSRMVGGNMQVDAGVHPGNSGGPITDDGGRVIGVVFSVQALPDEQLPPVYTIGYGIPIRRAEGLWPPPEDWQALLAEDEEDAPEAPTEEVEGASGGTGSSDSGDG